MVTFFGSCFQPSLDQENMVATTILFSCAFLTFTIGLCCLIRGMRRRR